MRDVFSGGSSGGHEGQSEKFRKNSLSKRRGIYSCLAFFSFGLMSILPASLLAQPASRDGSLGGRGESASSQIDQSIFASEAESPETAAAEQLGKNTDERCRLQADVALFLALQEQGGETFQTAVPCEKDPQVFAKVAEKASRNSDEALDGTIREMVAGYPVERMVPAIAEYDRGVAALIVGIAKKESDWGNRSPRDASGADCFNYWGYKGAGSRGVAMGHGCFGSPEEAVAAVGDRLAQLVTLRQTSEPKNMIIWKCGASCQGHTDASVKKWIADVSLYYDRIAVR